ncbi:hypothetical protein BpHYR1_021705 [Brachionus plicatilis]|uniref:Uncharacterized protein n=1 Tax=Brachionus plicatilis TaxID=10195 RepID=A0A3M7T5T5_BRAPC|nr:hypothetical protein BpHYR1_021705 [Brachionus plicatilis]
MLIIILSRSLFKIVLNATIKVLEVKQYSLIHFRHYELYKNQTRGLFREVKRNRNGTDNKIINPILFKKQHLK